MSEEKILAELEFKVEHLLLLIDPVRAPFSYLVLESNLSGEQVAGIYKLMHDYESYLAIGGKIKRSDFEQELYKIVPQREGNFHFAEDVVGSLYSEGRYQPVYRALKEEKNEL